MQNRFATLEQRVGDVIESQQATREQLGVIVMTSLGLERLIEALRLDVRELRGRVDRLESGGA